MEWINKIHQGHVLELLKQMPDDFVDMVITSPPYWGLRDYGKETETIWGGDKDCDHDFSLTKDKFSVNVGDKKNSYDRTSLAEGVEQGFCKKCGAWKGQLGLEPHPVMFIDNLVEIFREVRRVLKPTGSFYLNMGDSYFGGNMCVGQPKDWKSLSTSNREKYDSSTMDNFIKKRNKLKSNWLQPKQLMLIPSRVAVSMQDDGWCLRNDIIWHKPNPMPSSVKDRLNNTYEHVFHFVKKKKYHYDLDAIRIPHKVDSIKRACRGRQSSKLDSEQYAISYKEDYKGYENMEENFQEGKLRAVNPKGKNPGDVITKREQLLDTGMVRHGGPGSTLGDPDKWNPKGKNPGDTIEVPYSVQPRDKDFVEYRNLPDIKEFSSWLNDWRKGNGITIDEVEKKMESQAPHHWFNGESFPTVDDWKKFQEIYQLDNTYDDALTELHIKPAVKINHPLGKNPGDIIKEVSGKFVGSNVHSAGGREFYWSEQRVHNIDQKVIALYLKPLVKGHEEKLDELFGETKWRHWIRTDESGACLPSVDDWHILKGLLDFDCTYDRVMTETHLVPVTDASHPKGKNPGDFWDINTQPFSEAHFAVFPEELIEGPIKSSCPEDGIVMDIFAGSGTACLVAKKMGRNYIGLELNPEYVKMAEERVSKLTTIDNWMKTDAETSVDNVDKWL